MNVEHFLDTNIFVYMLDETDDLKRRRAEQLVTRSIEAGTGCISYQVVQETLSHEHPGTGCLPDDGEAPGRMLPGPPCRRRTGLNCSDRARRPSP